MKLSAAARTPMLIKPYPYQPSLPLGFYLERQSMKQESVAIPEGRSGYPESPVSSRESGIAALEITIPMRLVNPLNGSQGTSKKAMFARSDRRRKQRDQAKFAIAGNRMHWAKLAGLRGENYRILLTRVAPGKFDDDNLRAAFKAVRDGVADALGFKTDQHPNLDWDYAQQPGIRMSRKHGRLAQHEVRIRIEVA